MLNQMPIQHDVALSSLFTNTKEVTGSLNQLLPQFLRAARSHLGMDVAFLSEFRDGNRVFRHVESKIHDQPVLVGGSDPLEDSYCQRVVDGRLPELIQDAATIPAALELPVTRALPVGAHLSVPVKLKDGTVYGTFCCFSFKPDLSLNERDVSMMRVFAELAANAIERDVDVNKQHDEKTSRISSVMKDDGLSIVYQPIFNVALNKVVGFESLTRFSATPVRGPDFGLMKRLVLAWQWNLK